MRKRIWICAAVLCTGLCAAWLSKGGQPVVQAKEQGAEKRKALQSQELASVGNLIYRDGGEKAGICAADFSFLYGKLTAVSGMVFDPAEYTHTHQWEYRDVDESMHTRHCILCGIALTDTHKADGEEECTIISGEKAFPGRRYQCVCGYQWEREAAHVLTFDMVDETCHRSRCLLDGTEYCLGYDSVEEEHYAFYRTPDPAGTHYTKTCIDCGYQTEEEIEPEAPSVSENTLEEPEVETPEAVAEETQETDPSKITEGEMREPDPPEATEGEEQESDPPETTGGEAAEPGGSPTSEKDGLPEVSVSGNDCAGDERQSGTKEETNVTRDEEADL